MRNWSRQRFLAEGRQSGVDESILQNSLETAKELRRISPTAQPIFSLNHLCHLAETDYSLLRKVVCRSGVEPYTVFKLKKKDPRLFRIICVPDPFLLQTQRWINRNVLVHGVTHDASVAYRNGTNVVDAASAHCGCRWLIKMDICNFFESFSEIAAYRVFRSLGFQPLLSFEMARICTRLGGRTSARSTRRWRRNDRRHTVIGQYFNGRMGHLPQGAPTSPMLSNLAMRMFDDDVERMANVAGLSYTRYADDMHFSTSCANFSREKASGFISKIYSRLGKEGFRPNITKTRVSSPGGRKVVLGLLVDGPKPNLTRDFKAKVRMHLYYLNHPDIGPAKHAKKRKFTSVIGMKNHIAGLISYGAQVDPALGRNWQISFDSVPWGASTSEHS